MRNRLVVLKSQYRACLSFRKVLLLSTQHCLPTKACSGAAAWLSGQAHFSRLQTLPLSCSSTASTSSSTNPRTIRRTCSYFRTSAGCPMRPTHSTVRTGCRSIRSSRSLCGSPSRISQMRYVQNCMIICGNFFFVCRIDHALSYATLFQRTI